MMTFDLTTGQIRKRGTVATTKSHVIQFPHGKVEFYRKGRQTHYRAMCDQGYFFDCMNVVKDDGEPTPAYCTGTSSRGIRQFIADLLGSGGKLVK